MARRQTVSELYFDWLYKQISNQDRSYVKLCRFLHTMRFRWSVNNDDNRCEDGIALRDYFLESEGLDESHMEVRYFLQGNKCTVFECMVALAGRMDGIMCDLNNPESQCSKWFLEMLMNLKLAEFTDKITDSDRFDEMSEQQIYRLVEVWLDRSYASDGSGGLFPLKRKPRQDMRRVEIWYQMQMYLAER